MCELCPSEIFWLTLTASGMSSSVETFQCKVQAAHTHESSHWREAIHLQGESIRARSLSPPSDIVMLEDCQMGSKGLALMSDCPLKSDPRVSLEI